MNSSRHIIRKLSLEVQLPARYAGMRQEQVLTQVKSWLHTCFLPALEAALEGVEDTESSPGQYLCFDRIDIDLGRLAQGDLDLLSAVRLKQGLITATRHSDTRFPETKSPEQRTVEALAFFLQRGYLPWWYRAGSPGGWHRQLEPVFSARQGSLSPIAEALKNPVARRRLAGTFSEHFLSEVVMKYCFAQKVGAVSGLWRQLSTSTPARWKSPATKVRVWEWIFEWLSEACHREESLSRFIAQKMRSMLPYFSVSVAEDEKNDFARLYALWSGKPLQAKILQHREPEHGLPDASPQPGAQEETSPLSFWPGMVEPQKTGEEDIYVANAGLVLLHPYLHMFFEELKIAQAGELLQPEKAVLLLHYLSTGSGAAQEYELALNKILCGRSPETFVDTRGRISRREKDESRQLLEAVIRNWPALKSTSPQGLQGNFLCREGVLSPRQEGGWLLKVAGSTIDLLLDKLPWSISVVKLPWMPASLHVEWG